VLQHSPSALTEGQRAEYRTDPAFVEMRERLLRRFNLDTSHGAEEIVAWLSAAGLPMPLCRRETYGARLKQILFPVMLQTFKRRFQNLCLVIDFLFKNKHPIF
jgi:hypothetical protein